VTPTVAKVPE